jgi:hypothetical protein
VDLSTRLDSDLRILSGSFAGLDSSNGLARKYFVRDYLRPMCSGWTKFLSMTPEKMCSPGYEKMCSSEYKMKNGLSESFWADLVPNSLFDVDWNCWAVGLIGSRSDLVPNSPFDIDWNYWAAESIDLKSAPAPTCDLKNCESRCDSSSSASTLHSLKAA